MMQIAEIAKRSRVLVDHAKRCLDEADEVVYLARGVATRNGNVVHLAVFPEGLGGRGVLKECQSILARWLRDIGSLETRVRHGNVRAIRIAMALGFSIYSTTDSHVLLMREKGNGN
jgi:RimJ/RimL family protein N-acetyltransferase